MNSQLCDTAAYRPGITFVTSFQPVKPLSNGHHCSPVPQAFEPAAKGSCLAKNYHAAIVI